MTDEQQAEPIHGEPRKPRRITGNTTDAGIVCRRCACRQFFTTHTERLTDGRIRRRRTCRHCGYKLVTYEATTGTPDAAAPPKRAPE